MPDAAAPPTIRPRSVAAWAAGLGVVHLAVVVAAALGRPWPTLVATVLAVAADALAARRSPATPWALREVDLGLVARTLVRGLAAVLLAARLGHPGWAVGVAAAVLVAALGRAASAGAGRVTQYLRRPPVLATGLPGVTVRVPSRPPAVLRSDTSGQVADVLVVGALAVATSAGSTATLATVLVVAAVVALVPGATRAAEALRLFHARLRRRVPEAVEAALLQYAPRTAVYFGDGPAWRYQLEVWLPTLERLGEKVVAVVRDREVLRLLPPTTVPVICVPYTRTLLALPIPSLRAGLFVGNNAHNLHLLRRSGVRSAFIGHGDSDKGASANPFSRVYNEIWVAGPAGRERYRDAGVDVPDEAFVEVGRPTVDLVPRRPDAVPRRTVLYAPTWEGWGEAASHSSVTTVGPELVRRLLAHPGIRVMYRPHPRTGHLDATTRAHHREILRLMREAGADDGAAAPGRPARADEVPAHDALERAARSTVTRPLAEHETDVRAWESAYWDARPGHRVLLAGAPDVEACFAVADVLIGDVSSVVTDWLATDRPYAVVDVEGRPVEQFRDSVSVARGGFVLDPGLTALDEVLAVLDGAPDPTVDARRRTRAHLVRAYGDEALALFRRALDDLVRRAGAMDERTHRER